MFFKDPARSTADMTIMQSRKGRSVLTMQKGKHMEKNEGLLPAESLNTGRTAMAWRVFFYTLGMMCLACGVTMNTKTGLGVSCIISIPYSISTIWELDFGNITLIVYTVFVIVQFMIMRKVTLKVALQLPLSIVFTRFLNLFSSLIPSMEGSIIKGILLLAAAIMITAVGIILTVRTDFVPNPGDGIVNEIARAAGLSLGLTKNIFDISSVVITCIISMLAVHRVIGVGPGTVLTMIFLGRAVALFNWLILRPVMKLCGIQNFS